MQHKTPFFAHEKLVNSKKIIIFANRNRGNTGPSRAIISNNTILYSTKIQTNDEKAQCKKFP